MARGSVKNVPIAILSTKMVKKLVHYYMDYWKENIKDFVCTWCKGTMVTGGSSCGRCGDIIIAPDGHKYCMNSNLWRLKKGAGGILCSNCDGSMECPYCKGTGDSNKNNW